MHTQCYRSFHLPRALLENLHIPPGRPLTQPRQTVRPDVSLVRALAGDRPVVFDPAVHYGHAEVDLAMLSLFGRVPEAFYRAYGQNPRAADFQHRVRLYNLYHLLNHFNLFGGGYAGAVADSATALLRD